jgi:hypothetical protein
VPFRDILVRDSCELNGESINVAWKDGNDEIDVASGNVRDLEQN